MHKEKSAISFIDLHCDTASAMYRRPLTPDSPELAASFVRRTEYRYNAQLWAIYFEDDIEPDAAYDEFWRIRETFIPALWNGGAILCSDSHDFSLCVANAQPAAFLSLENAVCVGRDLTRLSALHSAGVRFIAPVWEGVNQLGGAWDTNYGLNEFGREFVAAALRLGIKLDVSHMNAPGIRQTLQLARGARGSVLATHCCAYAICPHRRNLNDEQFRAVRDSGGIVGLSAHSPHLRIGQAGQATIDDFVRHALHFLSIGGEDCLCLGCDFDGCEPAGGLESVSRLDALYAALQAAGVGDDICEKIFWRNAAGYLGTKL